MEVVLLVEFAPPVLFAEFAPPPPIPSRLFPTPEGLDGLTLLLLLLVLLLLVLLLVPAPPAPMAIPFVSEVVVPRFFAAFTVVELELFALDVTVAAKLFPLPLPLAPPPPPLVDPDPIAAPATPFVIVFVALGFALAAGGCLFFVHCDSSHSRRLAPAVVFFCTL